jgi:hypothetical protein
VQEERIGQERDLGADVGEAAVRGDEDRGFVAADLPQHTEDSDIDAVLQVLVAEVFRDLAFLADCADRVVLTRGRDESALGGDGSDSPEDRFTFVLECHEDELAMHR